MSFAKQSARIRLLPQPAALRAVRQAADQRLPRDDGEPVELRGSRGSARNALAAAFSVALEAIARLALEVGNALPRLVWSMVSWLVAEFLQGCALYAHTMYPMPGLIDDGLAQGDRTATSPGDSAAAPVARRPQLVVVSTAAADLRRDHIGTAISDGHGLRAVGPACGEADDVAKRGGRRR